MHAKSCHTKVAWDNFFATHEKALESAQHSWLIEDIFRILLADDGHLNYGPKPWSILLRGCIFTWNVELAKEIYSVAAKVASPSIAIPASKIFLESGQPIAAREIAQKGLRLVHLQLGDKLRLESIVARSYAEEGKQERALKHIEKIVSQLQGATFDKNERVDLLESIARLHFFLGSYKEAAKFFEEAAPIFLENRDWESAAKMLFNAAACFHNRGGEDRVKAFSFVEKCRRLAEEHQLAGPLAHCEAFYGVDAYHQGLFANAKEHFRTGLKALPQTDKSYRRLQILSMLTLTYFGSGKFDLAQKFGQQTLDLVALDKSARIHGRYVSLKAEMMWEAGEFAESTEYLRTEVEILRLHGVHKLEDLMTLTRWIVQSAYLGENPYYSEISIDAQLKNDQYAWIDYLYAGALVQLVAGKVADARTEFETCLEKSRKNLDLNHEAFCLIGILQTHLALREISKCEEYMERLEVVLGRMGTCPHKSRLQLLRAAIAYQSGDFDEAVKHLKLAEKNSWTSAFDRLCIHACLDTMSGKSPKMVQLWQKKSLAWYVRTHFAPSIRLDRGKSFIVSGHYRMNLERHPVLAELLYFLMQQPHFASSLEEIQVEVWKESLNHQGWQQKIRNSIMRLRDHTIFTVAPLIEHHLDVRLFSEAIQVETRTTPEIRKPKRAAFDNQIATP